VFFIVVIGVKITNKINIPQKKLLKIKKNQKKVIYRVFYWGMMYKLQKMKSSVITIKYWLLPEKGLKIKEIRAK
jgi:hypothetical protein